MVRGYIGGEDEFIDEEIAQFTKTYWIGAVISSAILFLFVFKLLAFIVGAIIAHTITYLIMRRKFIKDLLEY